MTEALSRALMQLAKSCLGDRHHNWALAMQAEFEAAKDNGSILAFACGCLIAACRELPRHAEGQLRVASHLVALGLLVPLASIQLLCGLQPSMTLGGLESGLTPGWSHDPLLASAQNAAMPILHILWLLLGAWHLHLAWVLLNRDWKGVVKAGSLIVAAMLTLFTFMGLLLLATKGLLMLATMSVIEAIFIAALSRWHAHIFPLDETAINVW